MKESINTEGCVYCHENIDVTIRIFEDSFGHIVNIACPHRKGLDGCSAWFNPACESDKGKCGYVLSTVLENSRMDEYIKVINEFKEAKDRLTNKGVEFDNKVEELKRKIEEVDEFLAKVDRKLSK